MRSSPLFVLAYFSFSLTNCCENKNRKDEEKWKKETHERDRVKREEYLAEDEKRLKKTSEELRKKQEVEREKELEKSSFARLKAVSFPWKSDSISDVEWSIPSAASCGKEAPIGQSESQRSALAVEFTNRLFNVSIVIENEPDGLKYNSIAHKMPISVSANEMSFSGLAPIKTEGVGQYECCHILTKECRPADGIVSKTCEAQEVLKKTQVGVLRVFDTSATAKKMMLPLKDGQEKSNFSGEAVIKINNIAKICDGKEVTERIFVVDVVGMLIKNEDSILFENSKINISVDDAKGGPESWSKKLKK